MTSEWILDLSDPRATLELTGGKAASLRRLAAAGLPVPGGFCVTTDGYRRFVTSNGLMDPIRRELATIDPATPPSLLEEASQRIRDRFLQAPIPEEVARSIVEAYCRLPETDAVVAVRSSATAEDLPEASFAGQQETYLNVRGEEAVLEAVRKCWGSLWTARAVSYRARQGISPDQVALAVVIQALVPADAAGILFTADPVTGERSQALINAAWGLGEAVVGGLVTPDTYVVEKATGRLISQQIADKTVMTVRVDGGTHEQPVPNERRRVAVLDEGAAAELAWLGERIGDLYGMPMDIEWARQDSRFFILQARPITALPEPELPAPTGWPMPNPRGMYMRGSIVDFMPDPLTPLFGSMVVPAVNTSILQLMARLAGKEMNAYANYLAVINGYPYISASYSARQWLSILSMMVMKMPYLLRSSSTLWKEEALPRYREVVAAWTVKPAANLSPTELLQGVNELLQAVTDHLTVLQVATLGVAPSSEGLLTALYNKLIKRQGDPEVATLLVGLDSTPIRAEKSLYDLADWSRQNPGLAAALKDTPTSGLKSHLAESTPPGGVDPQAWEEWHRRFRAHLDRYGYAIFNLDFSQPLPMDDPGPMIETLKLYLAGQGKNPYERQAVQSERRESVRQGLESRLKGPKAWAFRKLIRWVHTTLPMREDSIAEIGLAYPVIRRLLDELGRRFVESGFLADPGDLFWLEVEEVEQAAQLLEKGEAAALPSLHDKIRQRKALWKARKRVIPPLQLPGKKKILGINADAFMGVHSGDQEGKTIRGFGASTGQVTGVARVVTGPENFDTMHPGDVLVASITTPAWTPLFTMASAVVTDIGGPLSHGSIVAREYGIPAVLGTGVATQRIRSGSRVTVDGTQGTVTLHDAEPEKDLAEGQSQPSG